MNTQRLRPIRHQSLLAIALWLAYSMTTVITPVAPAAAARPKISRKIRWKPPKAPSHIGVPGNRGQGGGQRGDCHLEPAATALVPQTATGIYWGQTVSDRPTIWLHAPQGLSHNQLMEITVRAVNGKAIAKEQLTPPATPAGVISVPFPAAVTLAENQTYRWEVAFYCDAAMPDQPLIISGQIHRVAPIALPADRLEQVRVLADRGIWFDALTILGTDRRTIDDANLTLAWKELLQSAAITVGNNQINPCCEFAPASELVKPSSNHSGSVPTTGTLF